MKDSTKWILLGGLTVILGIIVLGNTVVASVAVAVMAGAMLLIGGGLNVVGGFSVEGMGSKLFAWIIGAVMLLLGWSLLAHPLEGVISLAMAVLILLIVGGLVRIFMSFRMSGTVYFWPMLISGILSLVLAWIIWANAAAEPATLFSLLGLLLGIEMLFDGIGLIFMGLFARSAAKQITT